MPPKKSKTRGRRKASDASSISEAPSVQSQTAAGKRTKRTLRSTVDEEHEMLDEVQEVIEEEEDELAGASQFSDKHVRFGSDTAPDEELQTTATHITPHPRKMAGKRRMTESPTEGADHGRPSKRFRRISVRHSLPAALSQEESDQVLEEHAELAPLDEILEERVQRRARIHKLQIQLEQQRKLKSKAKIEDIENELAELQEEDANTGFGNLDEQMLVLASQQQVWKSEPAKDLGEDSEYMANEQQSLSQSQRRSYESEWSVERKRLQDAILLLSHEANEAKTSLQVIQIELQGLGFAGEDAGMVVVNIREKLIKIRESLHGFLHPSTEDLSNEEMLDVIMSNVTDFADRLKTQHKQLEDQDDFAAELGRQIQGLIEHLAERDYRIKQLQDRWDEIDKKSDEKTRQIENLQEELQGIINERDSLDEELEAKTKEAETLTEENDDHATNLERLKASLKDYQDEESRLTQLIAQMEEEHKTTVSKMNEEREQTVRELEDRLDEENQARAEAEQTNEERQSMITGLELQIEKKDEELEALRDEIEELTAQREADAAEIQEKDTQVEDLETRVDRLDEELTALRTELEELRSINEDERVQHDAARDEIEDLNAKLLEQGKQGNELRQKLFEVQQANEKKVKELEQLASERDEQYQQDIAKEVERREASEELAQQRAATILEAESRIQEIEQSVAERDEQLADLEDEVAEKEATIETLQSDLEAAEQRYSTDLAQKTKEEERLTDSITTIKATLAERETLITQLQDEAIVTADLHNGKIEDRNATIAELNHDVAELKEQVAELEAEKLGLEGRVESEAQQMLQLQNDKADEIENLKKIILDKQEKILTVEEKAVQADQSWQEVLDARDAEIATLRETTEETSETVTTLTSDLNTLRGRFREYVLEKSAEIKQLKAQVDASADKMAADDEDVLQELESFEERASTTVTSMQVVQAKTTRGRKKRVMDSGIGLANGDDDTIVL